jgi:non-specific serine/threonine protein kinase
MIGKTLSHYRITARIGAGGMGEVYRAEDEKLGRQVALKLLPAATATDPDRIERFRREARAVAALNHPNIVTIYSVEEDEGAHFLTMELVEGRSLAEVLDSEGPLSRPSFLDVAVALADAVAAAHARGIVHRDLKPANMVLDAEGRLKVLDFGLAKLAEGEAGPDEKTRPLVTALGQVVGTAPYMSPEQANGEPVDERSDVFSLGALLHELATGRRAFRGNRLPAILHAVVTHQPPPVSESRADLPGLDPILAQCLIKKVQERSITADRVRSDLRDLSRQRPADDLPTAVVPAPRVTDTTADRSAERLSRRPVIAVLPFTSVGADAELDGFADSLGSDVVDGVTSTSQAVVLPGSATARFRERSADARAVGEELEAGYVVQGTVRRSGLRLRVAV